MICRRCLRAVPKRPSLLKPTTLPSTTRSISLLAPRRPALLPSTFTSVPTPQSLGAETLDLLPKISTSPLLAGIQVRNGPRDTYNMTHFVRKRRHGFLSRVRTRKGRAILARRRAKGRKNLSH